MPDFTRGSKVAWAKSQEHKRAGKTLCINHGVFENIHSGMAVVCETQSGVCQMVRQGLLVPDGDDTYAVMDAAIAAWELVAY